jgi:hypothetical protein
VSFKETCGSTKPSAASAVLSAWCCQQHALYSQVESIVTERSGYRSGLLLLLPQPALLQGLDAGDYSEVFRAGAGAELQQQPGAHNAAAAAAREQHGLSMDLHETGLSLSDRPGGIGLESADFRIDDDNF